jgi:hypothetical protein
MRMAVVDAADGVSGITANGRVWDLWKKSGRVDAELCHDQGFDGAGEGVWRRLFDLVQSRPRQIGDIRKHVYSAASSCDERKLQKCGLLKKEGATYRALSDAGSSVSRSSHRRRTQHPTHD